MTTPLPIPIGYEPRPLKREDVLRYRRLLAFQLRAMLLTHNQIAAVLKLSSDKQAKQYIEHGRKIMIDGVVMTVI